MRWIRPYLTCGDAVLDAKSLNEVPIASYLPADLDGCRSEDLRIVHVDDLTWEFLRDERDVEWRYSRPVYTAISCKHTALHT